MKSDLSFINDYKKEYVYDLYANTVDDVKDYESITRKKMIKEIYLFLSDSTDSLQGYISVEVLEFLKKVITNQNDYHHKKSFDQAFEIQSKSKFLLNYDYKTNKFEIDDDIRDLVLKTDITATHRWLDEIYIFLKGILTVRGSISLEELNEIYKTLKPDYLDIELKEALGLLRRIFEHVNRFSYIYDGRLERKDDFHVKIRQEYQPVYQYTWEMYQAVGITGLNTLNPVIGSFYNKARKKLTEFSLQFLIDDLIISIQYPYTNISQHIIQKMVDIEQNIDKAIELYNKIVVQIPTWEFKGDPTSLVDREVLYKKEDDSKDNDFLDDLTCGCGSGLLESECCENVDLMLKNNAVLKDEKSGLFYGIMYHLIYVTNEKYRIVPHYSDPEKFFNKLSEENFVKIKNTLFDSKEILDGFISENKNHFSKDELEIVTGLTHSFKDTFVAIRYEDQKLVLLDSKSEHKYLLSGIVSGISISMPNDYLPAFVETRLIPLNDCIIYDIHLIENRVKIGPNITKRVFQEEKKLKMLKNIEDIIESQKKLN